MDENGEQEQHELPAEEQAGDPMIENADDQPAGAGDVAAILRVLRGATWQFKAPQYGGDTDVELFIQQSMMLEQPMPGTLVQLYCTSDPA